jgi:hypothetical protein
VKFVRGRRGKPKGSVDQLRSDDRLQTKLWEAKGKGFKKKEAAVAEISTEDGQGPGHDLSGHIGTEAAALRIGFIRGIFETRFLLHSIFACG